MTRKRPSSRSRRQPASSRQKSAGRLRIIGGNYRRRLLPVLDHPGLRPTPDRVRETLFNWLAATTPGAKALDLYAGSGALGIEALSRGAHLVHFIERDGAVASSLRDNLATLGANGQVSVGDVLSLLAAPRRDEAPYSLVFLDPPFHQGLAEPSCTALEHNGWLSAQAWLYLETEAGVTPSVPTTWQLHREIRAGDSHGRLYRRSTSLPGDAC